MPDTQLDRYDPPDNGNWSEHMYMVLPALLLQLNRSVRFLDLLAQFLRDYYRRKKMQRFCGRSGLFPGQFDSLGIFPEGMQPGGLSSLWEESQLGCWSEH